MSLASAFKTGDLTELPGKRDEDWRWTDLRGLIREVPPVSPPFNGELPAGLFDDLAEDFHGLANGGSTRIVVEEGVSTVVLRFLAVTDGTAHAAKADIEVAPGASLVLLETYEGHAAGYFAQADLSIRLGEGSSMERVVLASDDAEAVSVSTAQITLAAGSAYSQTVLADGAKRQRLETRVIHPGAGASLHLDGGYLLKGRRHSDQTTAVDHQGVDGTTDQLIKGVVADQSRAVFQGRITVSHGADRTDARMGHHALILSDRAEVDAKPELLIFADDVQCAHGNTVGALDDDQIFYAEQRGLPAEVARALLTEAFVGEVVDRIVHDGAREIARAWVAERLGAN
jgi:Fe-S cluster assembly protein SufD